MHVPDDGGSIKLLLNGSASVAGSSKHLVNGSASVASVMTLIQSQVVNVSQCS